MADSGWCCLRVAVSWLLGGVEPCGFLGFCDLLVASPASGESSIGMGGGIMCGNGGGGGGNGGCSPTPRACE